MTQSKMNSLGYLDGDFNIKIVFEEGENTFEEFEDIFRFLNEFDKLYFQYTNEMPYQRHVGKFKKTQVISFSKQSPLEIFAFIEKNWFEILLFLISTNRRTIILNVKQYYQYIDRLIDFIEENFREIVEDFENFEMEEIIKFIRWFDNLTVEQKNGIVRLLKRYQKVMSKIKKLIKT